MSSWIRVTGATHQAAIAGKVVDAGSGRPVGGVAVHVTSMPPAFVKLLSLKALQYGAAWEGLAERPGRTRTAEDGCFCLMDLPEGDYVLSFFLPAGRHRYGTTRQAFSVARNAQGQLDTRFARISLPPTAIRGQLKGLVQGETSALPLARVLVEDSGEYAQADAEGRFYLTGVEPGSRRLRLSAAGFQPAAKAVTVTEGTTLELGVLELTPAP